MTYFRFQNSIKDARLNWEGMQPPDISVRGLYHDLRWHYKLYRIDKLGIPTIIFFLFLKYIQIIEYHSGWFESSDTALDEGEVKD